MIDRKVFTERWVVLLERFGRAGELTPTRKKVMMEYLEFLDAHLTTEQFVYAAKEIFNDEVYFPTPRKFVETAAGVTDNQLKAYWNEVLEVSTRYGTQGFNRLPEPLQDALRGTELWRRLNHAEGDFQRREVRRDLMAHLRDKGINPIGRALEEK